MRRTANFKPTVKGFIELFEAHIAHYHERKMVQGDLPGARPYDPNFRDLALRSVEGRITSKFRKSGLLDSSDPQVLESLKALLSGSIGTDRKSSILEYKVEKAITQYLRNGKIPEFPRQSEGRRSWGKRTASEILRDLEIRIANLEAMSASKFRNPYLDDLTVNKYNEREHVVPSELRGTPFDTSFVRRPISYNSESEKPGMEKPTIIKLDSGYLVIILGTFPNQKVRQTIESFVKANSEVKVERKVRNRSFSSGRRIAFADYILSASVYKHPFTFYKPLVKRLSSIENVVFDMPDAFIQLFGL